MIPYLKQFARRIRLLVFVFVVAAVHGGTHAVFAETPVPFRASGTGQILLQIDPTPGNPVGVQYYVINGVATLTGRFTSTGITYFTLDGFVSGELHVTAADGSTIDNTYTGTFAPIDATTFEFNVVQIWGDGTGRLAGVSGEADATAILDALTGSFPASAEGVWILP